LEGALIRVLAFGSLTQQVVTLDLAKKILSYNEREKHTSVDFDRIIRVLSKHYPYDLSTLRAKNRSKDVALARHIAMYLMKKLTDKSFREIGQFLGGRNHATVIHALTKIEEHIKADAQFQAHVQQIESAITPL
jgi:chromosomal replication initiator protein